MCLHTAHKFNGFQQRNLKCFPFLNQIIFKLFSVHTLATCNNNLPQAEKNEGDLTFQHVSAVIQYQGQTRQCVWRQRRFFPDVFNGQSVLEFFPPIVQLEKLRRIPSFMATTKLAVISHYKHSLQRRNLSRLFLAVDPQTELTHDKELINRNQ